MRSEGLALLVCVAVTGCLLGSGPQDTPRPVRPGADRLLEAPYAGWVQGRRLGLITNPSGVTAELETTADVLLRRSDLRLAAIFGPEHGFSGAAQAGVPVADQPRVFSLYGEVRAPTAEMLQEVDVLVYDLQDVGVRFYTYISTLFYSMQAAAQQGIPLIVLDRPNPIDGGRVEGPVLEPGFESFVGVFPLPIRYGMTAGELARLFNAEAGLGCDLQVVPLQGWRRSQWYDQTGLAWIMPSPNMPTLETALIYPGFCLLEGTNLSEGRGTTRPFELFGAPWLDSRRLAERLNQLGLSGIRFRPQAFTPTFSKYAGTLCQGVQVHVLDRDLFQPIPAVLHVLQQVARLHPGQLEFRPQFDRLAGNPWIRQMLPEASVEAIVARWQPGLEEFRKIRQRYLLYP